MAERAPQALHAVIGALGRARPRWRGPIQLGAHAPQLKALIERGEDVLLSGAPLARLEVAEDSLYLTLAPQAAHAVLGGARLEEARSRRAAVRRLILSPQELSDRFLATHVEWAQLMCRLRRLVVPDLHRYRGAMGAHMGLLLGRLLRLTAFYGAHPQIIASTAAQRGAAAHALSLFGRPGIMEVRARTQRSAQAMILGREAESELTAATISNLRALFIAQDRAHAQRLYAQLRDPRSPKAVQVLRGPSSRAEARVARAMREGEVRALIAPFVPSFGAPAELQLVAVVLPGSVRSTCALLSVFQRLRAGGLGLVLADPSPAASSIKKALATGLNAEEAHAFVDLPQPLFEHLRAAHYELPFRPEEPLGELPAAALLEESGLSALEPPAPKIDLGRCDPEQIRLCCYGRPIGQVDKWRAPLVLQSGAEVLTSARAYRVAQLDLSEEVALLELPTDSAAFAPAGAASGLRARAGGAPAHEPEGGSGGGTLRGRLTLRPMSLEVEERIDGALGVSVQRARALKVDWAGCAAPAQREALRLIARSLMILATRRWMLEPGALWTVQLEGGAALYERAPYARLVERLSDPGERACAGAAALLTCPCEQGCEACGGPADPQARQTALRMLRLGPREEG